MIPSTPEHEELRQRAREVSRSAVRPRAAHWDETETFPDETLAILRDEGFTGLTLPPELGGSGLGILEACIVIEEVARECLATAQALQMCVNGPPRAILSRGTAEQQRSYLPGIVDGSVHWAIAMTEPQAGSDGLALASTLRQTGSGWVLDGIKCYITGGARATHLLVFCRAEGSTGALGIGAVIVKASSPGFSVAGVDPKMGGCGVSEATLRFDAVPIPDGDIVLMPDATSKDGARTLVTQFNPERCGNAAMAVGVAQGAYELAVAHANTRVQFGTTIGSFQGIQWKLADMLVDIEAARLLMLRAAATEENGFPKTTEAVMAKLYASEMVQRVTNEAVQIHGHLGYTRKHPVERLYRDARGFSIGAGTSETIRNMLGKQIVRTGVDL